MTYDDTIRLVRRKLKGYGYVQAVKSLRAATGLSFQTSKKMVQEISDGAPWYRHPIDRRKNNSENRLSFF